MSDLISKLQALIGKTPTESTTAGSDSNSAGSSGASYNEVSVFADNSNTTTGSSSVQMNDEEYFWWEEILEEKRQEELDAANGKENAPKSFDETKLDSKEWNSVEAKENKVFGNVQDYTFTTSGGTKINLEDIEGVKIYENKSTGDVVIVGANGARINAGSDNAKITIYDSDIQKLNSDKGNDDIKIYNSNVGELTTGRGIDNVIIENSTVGNINTGVGDDNLFISQSEIKSLKTSDGDDILAFNKSKVDKLETEKNNDYIIASDSEINKLHTGKGINNVSLDKTDVQKITTGKNDTIVKDKNYLDIDKTKLTEVGSDTVIDIGDGTTTTVGEYSQYLLSQPVGFETEKEYQDYVLQSLTSNLETMKNVFGTQEDNDGIVSDGYNALKELTGLGISDKDIEDMIAKQEEMVNGLTAALNGESDMTFAEAYEYYTGTTYSKEKIDKYMDVANTYSAIMVGCQYDENYMEEFEAATGMSIEDVTKEYALCQLDTFGKSTGLQDLVEKYSQDQEGFADKLSSVISSVGMTCIVVGGIASFAFPPAGMALMTAGKYIALGGMYIDNAIDLVNDSTDKDGLTKEELNENLFEAGIETISYTVGRFIGKTTNGINADVVKNILEKGGSDLISQIAGQAAETGTDAALSLVADYVISQADSFAQTGELISWDDYWSLDRFLGEGKNQLIGILTGISSSKVSAYQQSVIATAGAKINAGDIEGARTDLKNSGIAMSDAGFENFVKQAQNVEVKNTPLATGTDEVARAYDVDETGAKTDTNAGYNVLDDAIVKPNTLADAETKPNALGEAEPKPDVDSNPNGIDGSETNPKADTNAGYNALDDAIAKPNALGEAEPKPDVDSNPNTTGEAGPKPNADIDSVGEAGAKPNANEPKLETINKATKHSDKEITDIAVNQQLSLNAVSLYETFNEHIAEVKAETKDRFGDLETVKEENITARAKGEDSTFSKLASKFKNGKLTSTDMAACNEAIGDAYGTRIQMNNVDTKVAETEITKALDGTGITYNQFVDYVTGKGTFDAATKQKLEEIKTPVLDTLKTAQSQEVVNRLVDLIQNAPETDPPIITELNNYGGTISSYFTDAQLEQIATVYSEKYGKPLDIVTKLDESNLPSGKLEVKRKDDTRILNVESSKAKYTDKGAIKEAGYTSSQMNTKHKLSDGTVGNGELQIRGTEVNAFADVEHIPYDIKQGKVEPDDPKYASIYKVITDMDESTYKAYNKYLTAVYDNLRLKELGIPVEGEPNIETYLKDSGLSADEMILLSREGLEKLH